VGNRKHKTHAVRDAELRGTPPQVGLERASANEQETAFAFQSRHRLQQFHHSLLGHEAADESDHRALHPQLGGQRRLLPAAEQLRVQPQQRHDMNRIFIPFFPEYITRVGVAADRGVGASEIEAFEKREGETQRFLEIHPCEKQCLRVGREHATVQQCLEIGKRVRALFHMENVRTEAAHAERGRLVEMRRFLAAERHRQRRHVELVILVVRGTDGEEIVLPHRGNDDLEVDVVQPREFAPLLPPDAGDVGVADDKNVERSSHMLLD
jgi:hypothetical protein